MIRSTCCTSIAGAALLIGFFALAGTAGAEPGSAMQEALGLLPGQEGWGWGEEDEEDKKEGEEEGEGWGGWDEGWGEPGPSPGEEPSGEGETESGWGEGGEEAESGGEAESGWGEEGGESGSGAWAEGGWTDMPAEEGGPREPMERGPSRRPSGKPPRIGIHAWLLGATPVAGQAGAGRQAPAWSEAYGFGFGGGGAASLRLLPCLGVRLGAWYQSLGAQDFEAFGLTNRLSDFAVFGLSLGPRFYFLTGRPVKRWFGPMDGSFRGFTPYIGFDFGLGFSSAVAWEVPAPRWDFWDAGVILVQEFVGGFEVRFADRIGFFLELGFGTTSAPPAASGHASDLNEGGSPTLFRFRLGVLFAF